MRAVPATLFLFVAPVAWAQSDIDAKAPMGADKNPAPPSRESKGEKLAKPSPADESVYVVQRRENAKSGRLELTPLFFCSLNNELVGHVGFGLALAYHVRENFAVELQAAVPYAIARYYSSLVFEIHDREALLPEPVELKQIDGFGTVNMLFSGLYGKLDLYGRLIDFDLFVTAGVGLVSTLEPCVPESAGCGDDVGIGRGLRSPEDVGDRLKLAGNLGGGMRFFFSPIAGLRLELRDLVYSDRAVADGVTTTAIRNHVMFVVGVAFLL